MRRLTRRDSIAPQALAVLSVLALAASARPPVLRAQGELVRDGLWGSGTAGIGWNVSDNLEGESLEGFAFSARGGWALAPRWLVGADLTGWLRSYQGVSLTRGVLTAAIQFYPKEGLGLFFRGGVGVARVEYVVSQGRDQSETGFGSDLGLGWDFQLGRSLAFTIAADWLFHDLHSLDKTNQLGMLTAGFSLF